MWGGGSAPRGTDAHANRRSRRSCSRLDRRNAEPAWRDSAARSVCSAPFRWANDPARRAFAPTPGEQSKQLREATWDRVVRLDRYRRERRWHARCPGHQVSRRFHPRHDRLVTVEILDPKKAADLKAVPLSYSREAVSAGSPPDGFRVLRRQRVLSSTDLEAASRSLLHWEVHSGAGLHVAASAADVRAGEVVVLTMGLGRVGLRAPCRILDVIDEQERRGFVYGTLPGHPESGEESFVLERRSDGAVTFTVGAVSRPASLLARLGGPVTRWVQSVATNRYLRAAG